MMGDHGHVTPRPDGLKARCGGPGVCPECSKEACTQGFYGGAPAGGEVACPQCGHTFVPEVRMTEAEEEDVTEADANAPYGDVEYADPGYQADGKKRYPVDTADHVRAAWSYINQDKNAAKYTADQLKKIKARIKRAAKKHGVEISEEASEALVNGERSFGDIRELVRRAIAKRIEDQGGSRYAWVHVADLTDSAAVYVAEPNDDLYQCDYTLADDGTVTLGEPVKVLRSYTPAPAGETTPAEPNPEPEVAVEATGAEERDADAVDGRLVEAKGSGPDGGRIFRMKIIAYGDSKNGRRYGEAVMRQAAGLYEGARAYDRHRTSEELRTGTTSGMVGYYRNVEAAADGIYGDLHLLPSSARAAEALDATLTLQEEGLEPLLGVSHDIYGHYRPIVESGRRLAEATAITKVNSVDLVAVPAAGGQATRMVAGGEGEPEHKKEGDPVSKEELLALLKEASPQELAAAGLTKTTEGAEGEPAGEGGDTKPEREPAKESEPERSTEAGEPKDGFLGKLLIRSKVEDAGLPASVVESLTGSLPERITEGDVDNAIASLKSAMSIVERAELVPKATVQVTKEAVDKKKAALDAFFEGKFSEGYYSFRQAFTDFTGYAPKSWDADVNRHMLRECIAAYDSGDRSVESLNTASWAQVLGDSITRRMVALYQLPSLQTWRRIVSSLVPVNDFRTQRIGRVGGYGVLPTVNEGAPYQSLTSPPDEESTYAIDKKGGTEDLTFEMIANDDVRAISNIPQKLGRAAAQTLYRFVWDFIRTNPNTTYDLTALFHANHGNTATDALSETSLSAARQSMREQVAYGDDKELLDLTPRLLIVPPALETLGFKLTTSAVSVGGSEDRTTPNLHSSLEMIVVPYFTADDNNWYLSADTSMVPTIEVGFYQGREDPEIFTQADPNQGSMFNADKLTYKIRHIYSGTILDHRGLYGALVA